jgi:hypothetical protein
MRIAGASSESIPESFLLGDICSTTYSNTSVGIVEMRISMEEPEEFSTV